MPLASLAALCRALTATRNNGRRRRWLSDHSGLRARGLAIVATRQFLRASGIVISQAYPCIRKGLPERGTS